VTDQAEFITEERPGITVLKVTGEIDILNAGDLRTAMENAATDDQRGLVVVLAGVSYFDSQTLEILVDFSKRLILGRRKMSLVAPAGSPPRRLLDISGISGVIPTYATVEEAARAIAAASG
jgi:anti-sigma B factor antagonist